MRLPVLPIFLFPNLNLKKNLLIGCISRGGDTWIPRGGDSIQVGDRVIVVTTQLGLNDLKDVLRK